MSAEIKVYDPVDSYPEHYEWTREQRWRLKYAMFCFRLVHDDVFWEYVAHAMSVFYEERFGADECLEFARRKGMRRYCNERKNSIL